MGGIAILVGSIIYLCIGIIACVGIGNYVGYASKTPQDKKEN